MKRRRGFPFPAQGRGAAPPLIGLSGVLIGPAGDTPLIRHGVRRERFAFCQRDDIAVGLGDQVVALRARRRSDAGKIGASGGDQRGAVLKAGGILCLHTDDRVGEQLHAHGVADERHDRRIRAADRQQKKQRRDETECRDL